MTKQIIKHLYKDRTMLARSLADNVAKRLYGCIQKKDRASIALSGGSTPKLFFTMLSQQDIPWEKVTVMLVDERYVSPDNPRSNEKLVRHYLMQNAAACAQFTGFWQEGKSICEAENILNNRLDAEGRHLDIALLGMGLDGHTASFFPGGNNLVKAMAPAFTQSVIQMEAEGAGEPRLTLTLPVLARADYLVLHIEGKDKRDVFDQAFGADLQQAPPIRILMDALNSPINLYWAP